jgi:hypothetical protein
MALLTSADGSVSPQATIGSTPLIRVALFDNANNQITAFGGSGGTASNFGAAFPTPGTAAGFSDGTNMQGARVVDADSDSGFFYAIAASPCKATTAGCVEYGTTTDPVNIADAGGSITVDGTVAATQSGNWTARIVGNAGATLDLADEGTFTDATSSVLPVGFVARSSLDTLTTGKAGAANMTLSRNLMTVAVPDNSALSAPSACYVGSGTGSTASTNATNCANAVANFYGGWFVNTSTTIGYVRFYNLSTSPTCSSATGFINSVPIPPAPASGQAGGIVYLDPLPTNFTTGVGWCITGGGGNTDNTNGPAGIYGMIRYKT